MRAVEGLDKIGEFISTTEERPLEQPDQPQQSLGQIAFVAINPQKDYQAASNKIKRQHEEAALYLIEKWNEKIIQPFSGYSEYSWGAHLYVGLHSHEGKGYTEWDEEMFRDPNRIYRNAAPKVMKAVMVRGMTLQQERIDGHPSPRSLYPAYLKKNQPDPLQRSLGEIAYTTRFNKDNFQEKSQRIQSKWESAAQYLLYVWHQRAAGVISHFTQYTWGTHLYIGVMSSINNGYDIWTGEPVEIRESYNIAASHVIGVVLRHTIDLQQKLIDGQPSPDTLFPAPHK